MTSLKRLYRKFQIYSLLRGKSFRKSGDAPQCYIFLAADYGNLGDVAITYAQKGWLKKRYPNHEIVEVPVAKTLTYLKDIKKNINTDDLITVVGGGNMGDMYGDLEILRLMAVKSFKKNKVILFPQTIDYSESKDAGWLLKKSQKIYSAHPDLTMMARENVSYEKMKLWYPDVNVVLTPDIVMTLNERKPRPGRGNVLTLCLREDKEKADNSKILQSILLQVEKYNLKVETYDTHIGGDRYSEEEKYHELEKIWSHFRKSRLVITDRLHGMIFAYITGTPAIVLPNSNFKVRGCYEWIKDCGNIRFVENDDDIKMNLDLKDSTDLDLGAKFPMTF